MSVRGDSEVVLCSLGAELGEGDLTSTDSDFSGSASALDFGTTDVQSAAHPSEKSNSQSWDIIISKCTA